jgi:NAD(P)H dehydrogenase (quinone)
MLFATAAEQAKLEVVALMSGWNPHPTHPSALTREHWIANQIYRWMPSVDVIHVNPGLFAFTYFLGLRAIVHFGMFMAPFGEGKNAPPSNEDIGRVAAAVLARPEGRIGKCYRPTGPQLITP